MVAHIGSLQFDRRSALRLRYRLAPGPWRLGRDVDIHLGKLSWVEHTLDVQARVGAGPWSEISRQSFRVLRPAWISWPLLSTYLLAGTAFAFAVYIWRRNRQRENRELLPSLNEWRLAALVPEAHEFMGVWLAGRYEAGELLARGGFTNVMLGYDRKQERRCAIKIFRREVRDNEWVMRRFEHEVAALRQIHHPHVVTIYAHGLTPSGAPYLVMEFIQGVSLRELLSDGALAPQRAARLLVQLAGALDTIHARAVCHRDLKPENVMIRDAETANEDAVLVDFSIAIVKDANEALHGLSRAAGTFDYMAPEQAIGYAEPSSDVYSLAKLTIEMLTGERLALLLPNAALDLPDRVREFLRSGQFNLSQESIELFASALEFDPPTGRRWQETSRERLPPT